jgi:hypothetical protein
MLHLFLISCAATWILNFHDILFPWNTFEYISCLSRFVYNPFFKCDIVFVINCLSIIFPIKFNSLAKYYTIWRYEVGVIIWIQLWVHIYIYMCVFVCVCVYVHKYDRLYILTCTNAIVGAALWKWFLALANFPFLRERKQAKANEQFNVRWPSCLTMCVRIQVLKFFRYLI